MKTFSFKILLMSVLAPSILYVLTLPCLERWGEHRTASKIRRQLIQNDSDLLQGRISLYDEVNRNVSTVLKESRAVRLGAEIVVRVTDAQDNVLYPYYEHLLYMFHKGELPAKGSGALFDEGGFSRSSESGSVGQFFQTYSDYVQGMKVTVKVNVPVTSWVGGAWLVAYILITLIALYLYYHRASRLQEKRMHEIKETLIQEKRAATARIELELAEARRRLSEIQAQEEEWLLEVDPKALEGLVRLRDEKLKLQAEEVLKRLNDGDASLKIRRKVGGVEKCDAYELGFGASGRIYYTQSKIRKFKVLRIGTKTSQSKDLANLQGQKS